MEIKDVSDYLNNLYNQTKDSRLSDLKVLTAISDLINKAKDIVQLSISDLLICLDVKPNDLNIEALESFLAELRAIFWLKDFGFTEITPYAAKKSPYPDFTAEHKNKFCAVEVFCLTEVHEQKKDGGLDVYVNFDPNFSGSKFGRDFISKASEKKKQLDTVNAEIKILLCAINSKPIIGLNTAQEMQSHAELLHSQLKWGNNYFVGLLTGVEANGIKSDVIYPTLPN